MDLSSAVLTGQHSYMVATEYVQYVSVTQELGGNRLTFVINL